MLNPESPLYDQHCAFTGRLQKYTRKEAMQIVASVGGFGENAVTKKTRFLILGTQSKERKSNKQLKAEKNLNKGQKIEIISELTFYNMLSTDGFGQICMEEWVVECKSELLVYISSREQSAAESP